MQDRIATQERPQNDYQSSSKGSGGAAPPEPPTDLQQLTERLHALEVAQATQFATQAGSVATLSATQAGATATTAAAQAGTWATMAAGSVALIVGIFLGIGIGKAARD
jgi:hypothetical protein